MAPGTQLIVATSNPGKLRELAARLPGYVLRTQGEFNIEPVEETGLTFVENAILKARHAAAVSGLPALADDSGIEVDALAGAPGIYSARFAGPGASDSANCARLLSELADHSNRRARFRCVLVVMRYGNDPAPLMCSGSWEGSIATVAAGDNGFGYDPLFIPDGMDCTAAELTPDHKNRVSHRGQALTQLSDGLPGFLDTM